MRSKRLSGLRQPALAIGGAIPASVGYLVIDATDPERLARFWCRLLDVGVETTIGDGQFVVLSATKDGLTVGFQRVRVGKAGKNRLHLDLIVGTDQVLPRSKRSAGGGLSRETPVELQACSGYPGQAAEPAPSSMPIPGAGLSIPGSPLGMGPYFGVTPSSPDPVVTASRRLARAPGTPRRARRAAPPQGRRSAGRRRTGGGRRPG